MAESADMIDRHPYNGNSDNPDVIRANIEQTRANMSETVNAIQTQLSPEWLKQKAKEATIRKVEEMTDIATRKANNWRANTVETIRRNPIPAALIGIGLGWLLFDNNNSDEQRYEYYPRPVARRADYQTENRLFREPQMQNQGTVAQVQNKVGEAIHQTQEKASDLATQTGEKLGEMVHQTQEKAGDLAAQTGEKLSDMATNIQSQAEDLGHYAQEQAYYQARRAKRGFLQMIEENPLAVGAMAMAVGAAVGLSVPSTRQEDEWLGETRDQLLEQAQTKVQDTMEKVQQVAQEAGQSAKETVEREAEKRNLPTP